MNYLVNKLIAPRNRIELAALKQNVKRHHREQVNNLFGAETLRNKKLRSNFPSLKRKQSLESLPKNNLGNKEELSQPKTYNTFATTTQRQTWQPKFMYN